MTKRKNNSNKFVVLSEFCNDVAKGLMIAGILGQVASDSADLGTRLLLSISAVSISLIFLYFSVSLSYKYECSHIKYDNNRKL